MTRCCGLQDRSIKHPISVMGRHSPLLIKLVTFVTLLLLVRSQQDFFRLSFNVTEGEPRGTFVGNVGLQTILFNIAGADTQLRFDLFDSGSSVARLFTLDEQTGVIRTNVSLDREDVCGSNADCPLTLNIGIHKRSGTSGTFNLFVTVEVIVRILDQNDNAPEFPQAVVTLTVPENMPAAYSLHTSLAADRDMVGQNSDISYTFETLPVDARKFQLDAATGSNGGPPTDLVIIVLESLDREVQDSYFVRIIASDNGSPRRSGSVLINIKVTDRNDNRPRFTSSNYTVSVNENAVLSTPILTVSAIDNDTDDNGLILYSLSARASPAVREHFTVGESDGKIYLSKPVDYETDKSFVFQIEAKDKGDPPQSSTAYVIVNITDVNDNAPEIQLNLSPEGTGIVENEAAGKFMGHISVSDLDQRDQGSIVCDIDDPSFRLDPFPGQANVYKIVLAQPLDHEVRPTRRVTIRCRDSGQNPLVASKTFDVNVVDVNDNAPRFISAIFNGSVVENNAVGTNVMILPTSDTGQSSGMLRIVAEDYDSGEFGRVTYSIPVASNFSINPVSGILTTLVTFDREARPNYTFPVVARDNGNPSLSSTATVVVTVLDENDHPPHFQQPIFFLSVREEQPPGAVCGRVVAEDEDLGDNAKMVYSIVRGEDSSDSRYFSVQRDTGEITTNQLLDRETKDSFTFTLEVVNPSAPYIKVTTQVRVDVQDDNDHDPVFVTPDQSNSSITLPNNTTVGSLILRASARDQDEVSKFEFSLLGSQRGSLFQIITVTGELILAREIRVTDAGTQTLLIVVSDGDSNPRSATATVLVTIPAEGLKAGTTASIMSEPNFIIIVVIVLVTLLVAILVFTIICCIFRRDRKRRNGRQQQRQVKDKMYQAAHWVSTHALPPEANGSPLHHPQQRAGLGDKNKGKKEVSFSLDEELEKMEGDPDTSGSLGSVFASQHGQAPDNNNLKAPRDGRFMTFVSGKTSPASTPSCYGSADGHSHTYHNTPIAETEDHLHMQLQPSTGEDALSASSGETATDSGRGGSEDEAHPNRPPAQETDARMFAQGSGGYGPVSGSGVDSRGRRKLPSLSALPEEQQPALHTQHPSPHTQHPPHQPQHNYFRSPAEQLPAQGLGYSVGSNSRSLHFSGGGQDLTGGDGGGGGGGYGGGGGGGGVPRDSRNYHSMDRLGNGEGPFRLRDSAPTAAGSGAGTASTGRRTFQTFGPQHQNNHPAWRRAKGLDGGWRSQPPPAASFATTEDDDVTTTSGSYTLGSPDREEPLSDLSDLAFRQIRDVSV